MVTAHRARLQAHLLIGLCNVLCACVYRCSVLGEEQWKLLPAPHDATLNSSPKHREKDMTAL